MVHTLIMASGYKSRTLVPPISDVLESLAINGQIVVIVSDGDKEIYGPEHLVKLFKHEL